MVEKKIQLNGNQLIFKTGQFAPQANAAVIAQMGETIVLATVVASAPREDLDYFPLYVEYQEKLYAGGIIKGSRWVKREGKPSDEAILSARLIDRSIRPLFSQDYKGEVQVVVTVLSVDGENDADILGICAASAALSISDIPWQGPVGAVRIGLADEKPLVNPVYEKRQNSKLDLVMAGTDPAVIMVEAGAEEIEEETMIQVMEFGHEEIKKIIQAIKDLAKEVGQKKQTFKTEKIPADLIKKVEKLIAKDIEQLMANFMEKSDLSQINEIKKAAKEELLEEAGAKYIGQIVDDYFKNQVRNQILQKQKRIDGRKPDKIRDLHIETGVLPRTHGSAIFQRGLTQALTITTLGSPSLEQLIESMEGEETKRYIHHYFMPPYSVGECGRFGWPSRREVGHGSLAERALEPVLPDEEKFPYTIRVVSEIMSSNGSTSMASVCGSSLSLMDAGVPIKKPVAGIAMGLIVNEKKEKMAKGDWVVLTDIMGMEDHIGDMDFKVAGTRDGVTALQMDVKTLKIDLKILKQGLTQAHEARNFILQAMEKALPAPRAQVSTWAPKISVLHIDKEKIGEIIGPGGRVIKAIIAETGVAMDVNDDGRVTIAAIDPQAVQKAMEWVEGLTREVKAGEIFKEAEVKRILPFGAFVEVLPGKEGLVHVSQISTDYVANPADKLAIGQKVKVRVKEIDDMGRINLSMLFGADANKPIVRRDGPRSVSSNQQRNSQRRNNYPRFEKRY